MTFIVATWGGDEMRLFSFSSAFAREGKKVREISVVCTD